MTREEAHSKLMAETRSSCTEGQMVDFLDMAVALGMLKLDESESAAIEENVYQIYKGNPARRVGELRLDEPKSVRSKTLDALFKQFGGHDIETMLGLIDEAGLRIVEK